MAKRVLVFGTYDVLHPGHRDFFRQAGALGDELYVVVALDATVKALKGRAPHQDELARLAKVKSLPEVTEAVLGHEGDKYAVIEELKPDVIALGYDQGHFADRLPVELKARGLSIPVVRLKAFHPDTYKSSLLRPPAK